MVIGFMGSGAGAGVGAGAGAGAGVGAGRLYNLYALCATCAFVVQQAIYAYKERNDLDKLSQVMFLMLCHVTCVAKQAVFCLRAGTIDALLDSLDDESLSAGGGAAAATLRAEGAGSAARLLRVYAGGALVTCVLWALLPVLDRLRGLPVLFSFWTGIDYDHGFGFAVVLVYAFYQTSLVAIGNTTMDAFIAAILDQCKIQTRILRMSCESMVERAARHAAATRRPRDVALRRHLVDCVLHYNKITHVCAQVQQIFSVPLLVQFGAGGWILCMAAYNMVSMNMFSIEFASTTLFISCILVELFLFCYYGNEVAVESSMVCEALYGASWHVTSPAFRRALVLVMERAKRPLRPAAGLVIPLSLDTYLRILKSSYSFYAVLRQTK